MTYWRVFITLRLKAATGPVVPVYRGVATVPGHTKAHAKGSAIAQAMKELEDNPDWCISRVTARPSDDFEERRLEIL